MKVNWFKAKIYLGSVQDRFYYCLFSGSPGILNHIFIFLKQGFYCNDCGKNYLHCKCDECNKCKSKICICNINENLPKYIHRGWSDIPFKIRNQIRIYTWKLMLEIVSKENIEIIKNILIKRIKTRNEYDVLYKKELELFNKLLGTNEKI